MAMFLINMLCFLHAQEGLSENVQYISNNSRKLQPSQLSADMLKVKDGNFNAAYRVGCHFVDSNNVLEGLKWLRIACILDYAKAQHEFYMYAFSINDLDKAIQIEAKIWLEKACATYEPARNSKANNLKYRGTLDGTAWK